MQTKDYLHHLSAVVTVVCSVRHDEQTYLVFEVRRGGRQCFVRRDQLVVEPVLSRDADPLLDCTEETDRTHKKCNYWILVQYW